MLAISDDPGGDIGVCEGASAGEVGFSL